MTKRKSRDDFVFKNLKLLLNQNDKQINISLNSEQYKHIEAMYGEENLEANGLVYSVYRPELTQLISYLTFADYIAYKNTAGRVLSWFGFDFDHFQRHYSKNSFKLLLSDIVVNLEPTWQLLSIRKTDGTFCFIFDKGEITNTYCQFIISSNKGSVNVFKIQEYIISDWMHFPIDLFLNKK